MEETKKCTGKCGKVLPLSSFYKNTTKGHHTFCIKCYNKDRANRKKKTCIKCKEEKLQKRFPVDSKSKDGHGRYCKKCRQEINKSRPTTRIGRSMITIEKKFGTYQHFKL